MQISGRAREHLDFFVIYNVDVYNGMCLITKNNRRWPHRNRTIGELFLILFHDKSSCNFGNSDKDAARAPYFANLIIILHLYSFLNRVVGWTSVSTVSTLV